MHNDVKTRNKNVAEFLVRRQCPDLVIANSEFTAASLPLQFAKIPRHVVIPCPVTPSGQRPQTTAERESIRAQMETPPDAVTIVLVGRPEAWKGHALLLEALARLRALPDWICWIIGGAFDPVQAAFLEQLKATARDTGIADRIRFVGQRQDVAEFLQAADLFCHPNLTPEPFGIVFIEALYAGLPVVSVNHGGAKEIVDASCGQLVEPNDPGALAAVLEDLIRDANKRVALGRNAPARGAAVSDPSLILAKVHEQLAVLQGIGRAKARSKNCPRETSGPEHEPSQQTVIQ
jgi:glycosyltransferase involved in cell wall biosynthesis